MRRKHLFLFIFVFLCNLFALSSCHYVHQVFYVEGAKIERNNYTIEYNSIDYQEDTIVELKITKKNDNDLFIKSAIAHSPLGSYKEEPKEVYFNDILQENKEKISLTSKITNVRLIYPIEVKYGKLYLSLSDELYNLRLETREYLYGTTTTQAS